MYSAHKHARRRHTICMQFLTQHAIIDSNAETTHNTHIHNVGSRVESETAPALRAQRVCVCGPRNEGAGAPAAHLWRCHTGLYMCACGYVSVCVCVCCAIMCLRLEFRVRTCLLPTLEVPHRCVCKLSGTP